MTDEFTFERGNVLIKLRGKSKLIKRTVDFDGSVGGTLSARFGDELERWRFASKGSTWITRDMMRDILPAATKPPAPPSAGHPSGLTAYKVAPWKAEPAKCPAPKPMVASAPKQSKAERKGGKRRRRGLPPLSPEDLAELDRLYGPAWKPTRTASR